jgi:nucleoside-triphosphatase
VYNLKVAKRVFVVTGSPGVGKTTVLVKLIDVLKNRCFSIGGMLTREVRVAGERVGFELSDIDEGRRGWLAGADQKEGPQVGKYRVNLGDLNNIGANAVLKAVECSDIVVVDEVGPMELLSDQFVQAVERAINSSKPVVCTVHWKMRNQVIDRIERREDAETFVVSLQNRDRLHEVLADRTTDLLRKAK